MNKDEKNSIWIIQDSPTTIKWEVEGDPPRLTEIIVSAMQVKDTIATAIISSACIYCIERDIPLDKIFITHPGYKEKT